MKRQGDLYTTVLTMCRSAKLYVVKLQMQHVLTNFFNHFKLHDYEENNFSTAANCKCALLVAD